MRPHHISSWEKNVFLSQGEVSSQKRIVLSRATDGDRRKGFGHEVILNWSFLFYSVERVSFDMCCLWLAHLVLLFTFSCTFSFFFFFFWLCRIKLERQTPTWLWSANTHTHTHTHIHTHPFLLPKDSFLASALADCYVFLRPDLTQVCQNSLHTFIHLYHPPGS